MTAVSPAHYETTVYQLTRPAVAEQQVRLWWLGQAGFALQYGTRRVLIDPYLSDSLAAKYRGKRFPHVRNHPTPVKASLIVGVDAVLHTHAHTDHMDPWTIRDLRKRNDPLFVVPRAVIGTALERGIPSRRVEMLGDGDRVTIAPGITVEAIPAAHETRTLDGRGDDLFLGYIIEVGGIRIYHSGDCVPYDGLVDRLRNARVDIALLPINGRDALRADNGVPGNFTLAESIALCRAAGIPSLIAHHFELFDFNTIDRADARAQLEQAAGDLDWTLPSLMLTYRVSRVRKPTNSAIVKID